MTNLPTIRVSVRALLIREGCILLCKYSENDHEWYVTPGGGLQHNELISEGLIREVLEETGYHIEPGTTFSVREVIADRMETCYLKESFHQIEIFCKAKLVDQSEQAMAYEMDTGQVGCEWVAIQTLSALTVYPANLNKIVTKAMNQSQTHIQNSHGLHLL